MSLILPTNKEKSVSAWLRLLYLSEPGPACPVHLKAANHEGREDHGVSVCRVNSTAIGRSALYDLFDSWAR